MLTGKLSGEHHGTYPGNPERYSKNRAIACPRCLGEWRHRKSTEGFEPRGLCIFLASTSSSVSNSRRSRTRHPHTMIALESLPRSIFGGVSSYW